VGTPGGAVRVFIELAHVWVAPHAREISAVVGERNFCGLRPIGARIGRSAGCRENRHGVVIVGVRRNSAMAVLCLHHAAVLLTTKPVVDRPSSTSPELVFHPRDQEYGR
jgi:hypothetical protein